MRIPIPFRIFVISIILTFVFPASEAFNVRVDSSWKTKQSVLVYSGNGGDNEKESLSYEDSDSASKGIVSSLTNFVNFVSSEKKDNDSDMLPTVSSTSCAAPIQPEQLLERIRDDYTVNNYLWTGNIDLSCFEDRCRFTDPTLTFVGTDKFVTNIQNLTPIVNALCNVQEGCKSDLLQIELNDADGYVQSRWNMVGEISALPWKPKIDVIGRTKFWYRKQKPQTSNDDTTTKGNDGGLKVYFYDEEWEIPAGLALLQLITPAGTIANTKQKS